MTDGVRLSSESRTQLRKAAKAFRNGGRRVGEPMAREVRDSARPIRAAVLANTGRLPQRGGLARWVQQRVDVRTVDRFSARDFLVETTVTVRDGDVRALDEGEVRHLVYGRRPLLRQAVRRGFVSDAFTPAIARARKAGTDALADAAATISREAR